MLTSPLLHYNFPCLSFNHFFLLMFSLENRIVNIYFIDPSSFGEPERVSGSAGTLADHITNPASRCQPPDWRQFDNMCAISFPTSLFSLLKIYSFSPSMNPFFFSDGLFGRAWGYLRTDPSRCLSVWRFAALDLFPVCLPLAGSGFTQLSLFHDKIQFERSLTHRTFQKRTS